MEGQNISDIIEQYLKSILADSEHVEIRRSEIADLFDVVPSQINYVIKTRFTIQNGYLVESKRGGGGYIRIERVNLLDDIDVLNTLISVIGDDINERDAVSIIQTLYDEDVISRREADLMAVMVSKQTLALTDRQVADVLRAHVLISLLNRLRYES
ncbi:CtsR family transcriptional regulator [Paucilactobacillus wasatchensis]|uniref:Transcriptional regulator CtsR n=1 Tax=Paucilactobacillus wasatchensis TaxID=1335616 RepID=A0A0D1A7V0_9LACO|nr:CtsR family transcriptional regulator [Paucilactobacillus wasatchensis]KIS02826.1 Transcriptional regulator CtsR [Paucilactobacillus wasatchensis]